MTHASAPLLLTLFAFAPSTEPQDDGYQRTEVHGYLQVEVEGAPEEFNGGFSVHMAAWPMLEQHPGPRFQSGLFSTWMFPRAVEPEPDDWFYTDIEGGLGWWRDTRFPTETPKFIMGGVAHNFVAWANGPGAGKGRDWDEPAGKYGVAQLSPWILWPPDGLNLAQGTNGELLGYGYLPLPLTEAKDTTAGHDVPTGDRSWTLFLDAENFKGPVAFFTPYFFSHAQIARPDLVGRFLDSQPSDSARPISMETQHIPAAIAMDDDGTAWARIARSRFPIDAQGESLGVHRMITFTEAALWDDVQAWFAGGDAPSGRIDAEAHGHVHRMNDVRGFGWGIQPPDDREARAVPLAVDAFVDPVALDAGTFGYRWSEAQRERAEDGLVTLPENWRLDERDGRPVWTPVEASEVPAVAGPAFAALDRAPTVDPYPAPPDAYVTPTDGSWAEPGPVAGPFTAELGDGSVVTYSWYRFADQPTLLNADLTDAEREALQRRVEMIHREWTKDRQYLPPAQRGTLASIDPALVVEPPEGLEVGYVPIVTRQELAER